MKSLVLGTLVIGLIGISGCGKSVSNGPLGPGLSGSSSTNTALVSTYISSSTTNPVNAPALSRSAAPSKVTVVVGPYTITSFLVTYSRVALVGNSGEVVILSSEKTFDMLNYQDVHAMLGEYSVPVGTYTQLKITVSNMAITSTPSYTEDLTQYFREYTVPINLEVTADEGSGKDSGVFLTFPRLQDIINDHSLIVRSLATISARVTTLSGTWTTGDMAGYYRDGIIYKLDDLSQWGTYTKNDDGSGTGVFEFNFGLKCRYFLGNAGKFVGDANGVLALSNDRQSGYYIREGSGLNRWGTITMTSSITGTAKNSSGVEVATLQFATPTTGTWASISGSANGSFVAY